jgi:nucleoside recognition membrane protein YjiH
MKTDVMVRPEVLDGAIPNLDLPKSDSGLTESVLTNNSIGIVEPAVEVPAPVLETLDAGPHSVTKKNVAKFSIFSAIGLFLFLAPIPTGDGAFNIPLGFAISWLESNVLHRGEINFGVWALLAICTISAIGSVWALIRKPEDADTHRVRAFKVHPLFVVSRVAAAVFAWMIFLEVGPEFISSPFTGGVMLGISAHLVAVFIFLGFAIPILTDFGIMEFTGALVAKVVRKLFTLPGRSSVDLMASWFGSSVASVILTRGQHEKGYYTGREAAVICTNFAFVSLPFSFVVANAIGIESHFVTWYLLICAVSILLAIITPRIWPLRQLNDSFVDGSDAAGRQTEESIPEGVSPARWGLQLATARAGKTKMRDIGAAGIRTYVDIYADLIPLILAWGTIALAIFEVTPLFQFISQPMGWYLQLFNIEGAMQFAPATLIGFLDMYLPAILLAEAEGLLHTQLILGALSIVQIIYMTETGISILKSKMPLNLGKLFAVFMIRTLIAIPVLTLLVNLFF